MPLAIPSTRYLLKILAQLCQQHSQNKRSMKNFTTVMLLGLTCCSAFAQYKCTDNSGKVAFQQTPCASSQKQQELKVRFINPPQPVQSQASGPQLTTDQRMLANLEHDRKLRELQQQIEQIEGNINQRNALMSSEIALLQQRKLAANNNLAGATWEQSISTEMQAVTQKYKTMNDTDFERLRQLRVELDNAKSKK